MPVLWAVKFRHTDDVKTVLFEAACFNGTNIRKSAKRIGLRTDASGKFEKSLDPNNSVDAINRACQLIQELGGCSGLWRNRGSCAL